jgi:hypothetical protein
MDPTTGTIESSYFSGELLYQGRPFSKLDPVGKKIPASNPVMNLDMVLQPAQHAVDDILTAQSVGEWWIQG